MDPLTEWIFNMEEKVLVKTNIPGLMKDSKTGALINKNHDEYHTYKAQKENYKRIAKLEQDVNAVKDDLSEIKNLIRSLVERTN